MQFRYLALTPLLLPLASAQLLSTLLSIIGSEVGVVTSIVFSEVSVLTSDVGSVLRPRSTFAVAPTVADGVAVDAITSKLASVAGSVVSAATSKAGGALSKATNGAQSVTSAAGAAASQATGNGAVGGVGVGVPVMGAVAGLGLAVVAAL